MAGTSARMLDLLSLLQARRDWPGPLLAERLDVSERTVRRDVDRLRELGYRVVASKGPDGGYRLDAGSELPPLLFDDDQAVALAVVLQTAAASGAGLEEAALRALATVRQVMPAPLRARVDALRVEAVPRPGAPASVDPAVLVELSEAARDRLVVRFDYRSPDRPVDPTAPPRRAEPHRVVTWSGRWYLVAWDLDAEDWRTYRVDRIALRSHRGARFAPREVPGGDVAAFVAGRFRGADGPGTWRYWGEAVLRAPLSAIAPYLEDATVEDLGEGRCRLRIGAWSWRALAATIGRFDAEIEAAEPEELREAFGQLAERCDVAAAASTPDAFRRRRPTP